MARFVTYQAIHVKRSRRKMFSVEDLKTSAVQISSTATPTALIETAFKRVLHETGGGGGGGGGCGGGGGGGAGDDGQADTDIADKVAHDPEFQKAVGDWFAREQSQEDEDDDEQMGAGDDDDDDGEDGMSALEPVKVVPIASDDDIQAWATAKWTPRLNTGSREVLVKSTALAAEQVRRLDLVENKTLKQELKKQQAAQLKKKRGVSAAKGAAAESAKLRGKQGLPTKKRKLW
jgi:hypothetical protein